MNAFPYHQINIKLYFYIIRSRRFLIYISTKYIPYNQTTQNRLRKILFSEFSFHSVSVRYFLSTLSVILWYCCLFMFISSKRRFFVISNKRIFIINLLTKYHLENVSNIKYFHVGWIKKSIYLHSIFICVHCVQTWV